MNHKSRENFLTNIIVDVSNHLQKSDLKKYNYYDIKGYLSEADILVNQYLSDNIKEAFPDDLILSEEAEFDYSEFSNEHIWIIDPICGTTNFVNKIPLYVHSISVANKTGLKYASIYDPNRKELFVANEKITKLNGRIVNVSDTKKLDESVISINTNQSAWKDNNTLSIQKLVDLFAPPISRRIKIIESANMELAYVACGRLDAYICLSDKIWDMAAGYRMIESSGGKAIPFKGSFNPLNLRSLGVIASNKLLIDSIYQIILE